MEFQFIETVINNLTLNLEILNKDSNPYTTLLFQHKGTFSAGETKFGNQTDCSDKFNKFLTLAKTKNVSLALTPEYSCPWASIEWAVSNQDRWPNQSKLWAICSESITPAEIRTFKQTHHNGDIIVHFDETALNNGGGVLLDPMCYFFKATENNVEKLIILIQFKTQHMGVWEKDIERQKYIWGTKIYVLRNSTNSIFLFTNICSEAANFSITNELQQQLDNRWDENPYIILSPQMNPKPSHDVFKTFRKTILAYSNKDIISLNWAGGTMFPGKREPLIPLSKSSIFFKTPDVDFFDETRFINNHNKGLYYINKKSNAHAYYLNPYEEVFLIANQKPSSAGTNGALIRRTGPEGRNVFQWDVATGTFIELNIIEDGFINFMDSLTCNNPTLKNIHLSFIDKERLINLSTGQISTKNGDMRWQTIDKLETFFQDDNEGVKRLTYVHDETSITNRTEYLEVIDTIHNQILPDQALFPDNLLPFKNNCSDVMFFNDDGYDYKFNLVTNDSRHKATIAYIGRNTEASAKQTLQKLQKLFEKGDQSRKLVVVWYKEGATNIVPVCEPMPPKVTDDSTTDPNSIR
ncbi:MAG: hypothetical protein ACXVDZ_14415 [Bacteroidia bacterium]